MSWQPAYGGAVLALRDRAGRIDATIDGPHPAGYLLTVFTPARSTSLHGTLADATNSAGLRLAPDLQPSPINHVPNELIRHPSTKEVGALKRLSDH